MIYKTQVFYKMQKTYISNNCSNISFYFKENREYDHPIIGALFVNDHEYVKFCKNFYYYIHKTPVFREPRKDSVWAIQNGSPWYKHKEIKEGYPVMYLEDIEIHWIHEDSIQSLLEKYERRIKRLAFDNVYFLLSASDLCNDYKKEEYKKMVKTFLSIPKSLYLTRNNEDLYENPEAFKENRVKLIERWIGTDDSRNSSHILNIHTLGDRILDYEKLLTLH